MVVMAGEQEPCFERCARLPKLRKHHGMVPEVNEETSGGS